ncbi:MAG: putative DNA binding domain-containing protein [Bacteroidales bacterium]|nr:putative DNA binding domain-containing protein [Bacteroidales bacterium]
MAMTIEDIGEIISGDETRTLELKKSTGELKDAMRSACAFLNSDGGWLIFGVAPTSLKIVGQQVTENTRREIAHEITKIEPSIDLRVEYIDIPEKSDYQIIAIHLNAWPRGTSPYTYDNRPYYRVESTTKIMPREMFEARIRESKPHLFAWERLQSDSVGIEDLDDELITGVVRSGVNGGRLSNSAMNDSIEQILRKLQLLNQGRPNNAAVALFAKEAGIYTQLQLRMARFKGNGKNEFGDNQLVTGNFFRLFDAGMAFFFKHLNLSGKIVGVKREEELEIPYVALREALINALCHRSYDSLGPSVGIAIFDDRVEIENPGSFPENLTAETIKQPHDSYPKNPLIANVLYLSTYLEKWGSGVSRIMDVCKQHNVPEPIYEDRGGFIHIIFKRNSYKGDDEPQNEPQNEPQKTYLKKLSDRQRRIINAIQSEPRLTKQEIAQIISVSESTVSREIKKINNYISVYWSGPSKGGNWIISIENINQTEN